MMNSDRLNSVTASPPILEVDNLCKFFSVKSGIFSRNSAKIHAVEDISFTLSKGESLGIVGESGCGKTTAARLIMRLIEPSSGRIKFTTSDGTTLDADHLNRAQMKRFRQSVQLVFQDPYESLDPRKTVLDSIAEPLSVHGVGNVQDRVDRVAEILEAVELIPYSQYMFRYPHELSGGQRQRTSLARALVLRPDVIVADEPTSMLDIAVRTSIMKLMLDLQQEMGVSYIYITHDMAVARYMCNRIAVMYLGKIIEIGESDVVLQTPVHPYTRALISAILEPGSSSIKAEPAIKGGIAKPINPPPQCRFLERCLFATNQCRTAPHPPLESLKDGRMVACYNPQS